MDAAPLRAAFSAGRQVYGIDGRAEGEDPVLACGGAWIWGRGGTAGDFGEYGEKFLPPEPFDRGGGEGAGCPVPPVWEIPCGGAGAEGAEILLRGLPPGMVEGAPGVGTPGGVLYDLLRPLQEGI